MNREHFFNLHDPSQGIARTLAEGIETRIFPGENMMLSVVRIAANQSGKVHSHPQEQWGILLQGSGVRTQDGVDHKVEVGDFWQTPGGVSHGFRAGAAGALVLDIFSPPREEYRQAGTGFSDAGLSTHGDLSDQ
jgi:quercetin dioxygenase-like cupin family protein